LVGKSSRDRARDSGDRCHERSARGVVKVTHVKKMLAGNDQGVTEMKLAKVNKGQRQIIFPDDTGRLRATHDPAEAATVTHEPVLAMRRLWQCGESWRNACVERPRGSSAGASIGHGSQGAQSANPPNRSRPDLLGVHLM
jgi:hypothetical protein